jgi:cell division septation protein DedD
LTRDELLKKCVDRGVADKVVVEAVSHLFYVYLLSALQKGQRLEIPGFGTFGTRVVGVKRARRMPFFEPDGDLADRVNERYRSLKYLVLGRYELISVEAETEYKAREEPVELMPEPLGKEMIVDMRHEISLEEYERLARKKAEVRHPKEKITMPQFDLKGEEVAGEPKPEPARPEPRLHEAAVEGEGKSVWPKVLIGVLLLALVTVGLHFLGVIQLWKPEAPKVETALPPAEPVTPQEQAPGPPTAEAPTTPKPATPLPGKPAAPTVPPEKRRPEVPAGTGAFTVQVSSWRSQGKASAEANRLVDAGFDAFVEEGIVEGIQRYRVRIGRYTTRTEAASAAERLSQQLENGTWVARIGM